MVPLNEAAVYWIRLPEHTDPLTEGYVGVSKNWVKRVRDHMEGIKKRSHTNTHFMNASLKYGVENLVADVILMGEEKFCYEVESSLRPKRKIGWNLAPGGHRGPGRNKGSPGKIRTPEEQAQYEVEKQERDRLNGERTKKKKELESLNRKIARQNAANERDRIKREEMKQRKYDRQFIIRTRKTIVPENKNPTKKSAKIERHRHNIHIREQEIIVEKEKFDDPNPTIRHNAKMRVWELEIQIKRYQSWLN